MRFLRTQNKFVGFQLLSADFLPFKWRVTSFRKHQPAKELQQGWHISSGIWPSQQIIERLSSTLLASVTDCHRRLTCRDWCYDGAARAVGLHRAELDEHRGPFIHLPQESCYCFVRVRDDNLGREAAFNAIFHGRPQAPERLLEPRQKIICTKPLYLLGFIHSSVSLNTFEA